MSTMLQWPKKDEDEKLDYSLDWTERLDSDTILDSDWEVTGIDDDLIILTDPAASFTDTSTTLWLSGGTNRVIYRLTNTVTTAAGRIMQQSALLEIMSK